MWVHRLGLELHFEYRMCEIEKLGACVLQLRVSILCEYIVCVSFEPMSWKRSERSFIYLKGLKGVRKEDRDRHIAQILCRLCAKEMLFFPLLNTTCINTLNRLNTQDHTLSFASSTSKRALPLIKS